MQELETIQVSGPMSSNSGYPKGSIYNPYSVNEFEYMFEHGLWILGAYVETMGYVMPTLYVTGNTNANPPYGYIDWSSYSAMNMYSNISGFAGYCSDYLYYGSNGEFYWQNPINGTRFYGNQYVCVKKLSDMAEYANKIRMTKVLGNIATYGGYIVNATVHLYEGDLREFFGNAGAAAGTFSGYYLGIAFGGGVATVLLTPTAPVLVVASAVGAIALSIGLGIIGKDLGYAIHDIYKEYFNAIIDNE